MNTTNTPTQSVPTKTASGLFQKSVDIVKSIFQSMLNLLRKIWKLAITHTRGTVIGLIVFVILVILIIYNQEIITFFTNLINRFKLVFN